MSKQSVMIYIARGNPPCFTCTFLATHKLLLLPLIAVQCYPGILCVCVCVCVEEEEEEEEEI